MTMDDSLGLFLLLYQCQMLVFEYVSNVTSDKNF